VSNKIEFPPDFLKPKLKLSPYRALEFQAVEAPRISGYQHEGGTVVSLCTSCLNPKEKSLVLVSVKRPSLSWGHCVAGRTSIRN